MPAAAVTSLDLELADEISQFYADPLGFVKFAYPWGERGTLADYPGPDTWQEEALIEIGAAVAARGFDGVNPVAPIQMAISSGHGIGKSTFLAWVVGWIMSTRPHAQGTVTANTFTQLQTKTWAQIKRWNGICITGHWFRMTEERMINRQHPNSWYCSAQTSKEENSEAFAGQHAASSTSFYIFDEASNIPAKIWEVADGGLTDGEPMFFAFGNPTKNQGAFFEAAFGRHRDLWSTKCIDSRTSRFTNKEKIARDVAIYGEDSDRIRVRVRGLPPASGDLQYISSELIAAAQRRAAYHLPDDPIILGMDVARGGTAHSVMRFRQGLDAASIQPKRFSGQESKDTMRMVSLLINELEKDRNGKKVAAAFVDSGFGGPIVDRCRQLGYKQVHEVSFGAQPPDSHYLNMRSYMWGQMRDWLERGSLAQHDDRLGIDLGGPEYHHDRHDKLVLESKEDMSERGLDSPDDGDALALTFAQPVGPMLRKAAEKPMPAAQQWSWG